MDNCSHSRYSKGKSKTEKNYTEMTEARKTFFFFFLCGIHHSGCVAPNADISLQSGRFWATVIASSSERLFDLRSCWIVFIHVVQGRPDGLLQFSEGEAFMILLDNIIIPYIVSAIVSLTSVPLQVTDCFCWLQLLSSQLSAGNTPLWWSTVCRTPGLSSRAFVSKLINRSPGFRR